MSRQIQIISTRGRPLATIAGMVRLRGYFPLVHYALLGLACELASPSSAQEVVVPLDATWKYLSPNGAAEDPAISDPTFDDSWYRFDFDDNDWNGPETGPFRYGTINALTTNPTVTFLTQPPPEDRYTNYFRLRFSTTELISDVGVEFVMDDGAVAYLDGAEVLRWNCCIGGTGNNVDDYFSFALREGNEQQFETVYIANQIPPGEHLLAVSVHQVTPRSIDLGLGLRVLSGVEPPPAPDPNAIAGIDTTVAEAGQLGPDVPHGSETTWQWDQSDAGGQNHGLLWFDIPHEDLANFGNGSATLRLIAVDGGHGGSFYRMTADWLSGPSGGNNVTWNSTPVAPGVVPGHNAEVMPSFSTGNVRRDAKLELDVTADVVAWASGQPNYGWGVLQAPGGDGVEIASFESPDPPQLIVIPEQGTIAALQAGDADEDLDFDQFDLVEVFLSNKYLTGQPATWGEGDWDAAPGGSPGNPPRGDGVFDQRDIVAALAPAHYLSGPYAALQPKGQKGDSQTSVGYDAGTGELWVDPPNGTAVTSISVESESGIFRADPAVNLGGSFDVDSDESIFKATFGTSFGSLSFGNVAQPGLTEEFVLNDLTLVGSLAGGSNLGDVDLIYVPSPSSVVLLALGAVAMVLARPSRTRRFMHRSFVGRSSP